MEVTSVDHRGALRRDCAECLCKRFVRTVELVQLAPCNDCWHRLVSHSESGKFSELIPLPLILQVCL